MTHDELKQENSTIDFTELIEKQTADRVQQLSAPGGEVAVCRASGGERVGPINVERDERTILPMWPLGQKKGNSGQRSGGQYVGGSSYVLCQTC